jgi:Tol biopolymer transport system component
MNLDGTGKTEFSKDIITSFNIQGDHMYYNILGGEFKELSPSEDELSERSEYINTIYRVDLDGNNKTTIAEGGVGNIVGDWNYFYADYFDENVLELERIRLDGTGREKVI